MLEQSRARLQSLPQGTKDAALFFLITVVAFTVAGAIWGALYPTTELHVSADLGAEVVPETEGSGFKAYAWYMMGSAALGLAMGMWAYKKLRRGLGQLFWIFLWILFGAWWAIFIGAQVVEVVHPMDHTDANPGDVIHLVDFISAWPVVLVAPTIAVLSYWIGAVMADPDTFDN